MSFARLFPVLGLAACAARSPEPVSFTDVPTFHTEETGTLLGSLPVTRFRYDNGLQLIVVEDHSAPVAAYHTWYAVGSSLEEEGKTGLAHLFEHMMFKATEDYPEGGYDRALESLGANGLNAWTWLDETVYVQSVPVSALDKVAELESTRMTKLIVDADALDSEREVVINERRLRVDNDPGGKLNELLYATAFDTHTYGWPTIGWMKDLEGLSVEDCVDFYRTWYAPNNATVIVVGDVEPMDVAATVLKHYGRIPASELPDRKPPAEPPQAEQKRAEVEIPTTADRVQVGFKSVAAGDADLPVVYVIDAILSAGRSSRLRRALIDTGLASELSTFSLGMAEPGLFELDISAREGVSAEQIEEALFAELESFVAEGPTAADLERGIRQTQAASMGGLTGAAGKAQLVGWFWRTTGDWR
ncbi:MAG: insulinase family protein, partial [Deltaproteobacteria bacterium]